MDDPGDGDVRGRPPLGVRDGHDGDAFGVGPVDVGQFLVERSVDGGGHRQAGVPLGIERTHHAVVVHDVAVLDRLVGVHDVADLRDDHPDPGTFGRRKDPLAGDRAGRIAGGEEEHLVAGILQAAGQLVDH